MTFNPDYGDLPSVTDTTDQPTDASQYGQFPPLAIQSTERIAQMARMRLQDIAQTFDAKTITNGAQWRFELPFEKIEPLSLQVVTTDGTEQNTTNLVANTDYTADYRQGVISLNSTPAPGLILVSTGTYYRDFTAQEMDVYVRQAYLMHTDHEALKYQPNLDVWPEPSAPDYTTGVYGTAPQIALPEVEEYPLSLLVASLCLWDMAISGAQEIDVRTPDGVTISRGQRFSQITQMITELDAQYQRLCSVLNVGMYAISQGDLRRVSRTTNRYIPIFRPREFDDLYWAQRELPPIPSYDVLATFKGQWTATNTYIPGDIVVSPSNNITYKAIQHVPTNGPDPANDVNPQTNQGFYWVYTNAWQFSQHWWGAW